MNMERIDLLARTAAQVMLDRDVEAKDINRLAFPLEVTQLPTEEHEHFTRLMCQYMRELISGEDK